MSQPNQISTASGCGRVQSHLSHSRDLVQPNNDTPKRTTAGPPCSRTHPETKIDTSSSSQQRYAHESLPATDASQAHRHPDSSTHAPRTTNPSTHPYTCVRKGVWGICLCEGGIARLHCLCVILRGQTAMLWVRGVLPVVCVVPVVLPTFPTLSKWHPYTHYSFPHAPGCTDPQEHPHGLQTS